MASHNKFPTLINKRGIDLLTKLEAEYRSLPIDQENSIIWTLVYDDGMQAVMGFLFFGDLAITTFIGTAYGVLENAIDAFVVGYKKGSR